MEKQLRFTKRASEISKMSEYILKDFSLGEAMEIIQKQALGEIKDIIIILEQECEDWGVTEELFSYFAETILTFEEDDQDKLSDKTKLLISKLNKKFNK